MNQIATLGKSGRLVIPIRFRKMLGLNEGEGVMLKLKGDHIEIAPAKNSVQKAQLMVNKYLKNDESLVDMLFDERKADIANEH